MVSFTFRTDVLLSAYCLKITGLGTKNIDMKGQNVLKKFTV